jgi:hypothetical protein
MQPHVFIRTLNYKYPPPEKNISQCHLGEKYEKREQKKIENVKEKGRKGKKNLKLEVKG